MAGDRSSVGQLALWDMDIQPIQTARKPVQSVVCRPAPVESSVKTYWRNEHTGTCQQRDGATLWPTTSLWIEITQTEYDRWVTLRRAIWTWPKAEQIATQEENVVIIGV